MKTSAAIFKLLSIAIMTIGGGVNGYAIAQEPITRPSPSATTLVRPRPPLRDDNSYPNYNINDEAFIPRRKRRREPFVGVIVEEEEKSTPRQSLPTTSTYDLGLGKNKPVVQQQQRSGMPTTSNMEEVLMNCNQYESVREFPSPINKQEQQELQYETTKTRPQRKMMPINPIRFVEDSLPIVSHNSHRHHHHKVMPSSSRSSSTSTTQAASGAIHDHHHNTASTAPPQQQPVMVHTNKSQEQLDVNTVWVEMLIHSEQRKFAMMTTTSS